MKLPEELRGWDFPDTVAVPDGYDQTRVPDNTRENMLFLMEEHNKVVEVLEFLVKRSPSTAQALAEYRQTEEV